MVDKEGPCDANNVYGDAGDGGCRRVGAVRAKTGSRPFGFGADQPRDLFLHSVIRCCAEPRRRCIPGEPGRTRS